MKERTEYTKTSMLLRFLKGSMFCFIVSIAASAVVAGVDMVTPQIIRIVVDYCLSGQGDKLPGFVLDWLESIGGRSFVISHLYLAALAVVLLAAVAAIFRYLSTSMNTRGTERMVKTARDLLFAHIEKLPFDWHMKNATGDIIQRCTSDMNTVRDFVSEQLLQVIRIVIMILVSTVFMLMLSLKLAVIVLISVPLLVCYSYFFYQKIGHLFKECDENEGELSTIAQENLTGVRVVRAFGREAYERERFGKQNHKYTDAWMSLCRILAFYWASGDLLMGVQMLLIVVLGSIIAVRGEITPGELIAFVSYNNQLIWPVRRLGRVLSEMSKAGVSMDRLRYILNSKAEHSEGSKEPAMTGDIKFDHVSFGYTEDEEILKDVSFTIHGGQTIGILGTTGSGKSTLMHLLNQLYLPDEGRITIDGVPLEEISRPWLRSHIGMVLQEPYLFSRTLAENIAMAVDADEDDIRRASAIAALDESVGHFAKGYDTLVGERGVTLSGGQKQRTAIARMLVQKTPIMVFDDSLSAVDAETDAKIRRALGETLQGVTVILISHRISTLMGADRIFVMDKGKIVEEGTHKELIQKPGLYRRIYEIQKPDAENLPLTDKGPESAGSESTGHESTDLESTGSESNDHETIDHETIDHETIDHETTDHKTIDRENADRKGGR